MSSQAPGWYPDPYQRHESRYWNGQVWSEHVNDHGQTFVDPLGVRPPQAASAPAYAAPWAAPAQAAPRRSMVPIVLAGVVVVALVAGGVGLFIVSSSKPSQVLTGTATSNTSTTLKGSNGWQLDIPVGAVPADSNGKPGTIVVSVDKAAAPADVDTSNLPSSVKMSGDVFQIEPDGQTFVTPVTLTLPIPQDLQADKVGGMAYLDVGTHQWVAEPAEVDAAAGVIRARISHFSFHAPWGDYRDQLQAWQKKNGGYFDVTNTHVATDFFPSEHFGVPLPRYGGHSILYGFCISQMTFDDSSQTKDSSWYVPLPDMFTVFTMPDGHNPGGTSSYWLPKGTYEVDEVWYGGEYVSVADPFYSPVFGFAHRPLGNLKVTAGSHRAFEESSVTLEGADGWVVGRPNCAGKVVPSPGPDDVSPSPTRTSFATPRASASPSVVPSKSPGDPTIGNWQFVEAKGYPNATAQPGAEWTMTADAGHLHFVSQPPSQGPMTVEWNCNWTAAKKLEPGKIVEATVSCTDSSTKNSDGNWYGSGPGMTVYIEPPTIANIAVETWCLELSPVGFHGSGTAKASCKAPAGPLASVPWIALQFTMGGVGYAQWIYKWVPGGA